MHSVGKKLHHKVARFYLKAWDEFGRNTEDAQIFCLQNRVIQRRSLRNVAAENHFYRLRQLSDLDVEFIRKIAVYDSPSFLKPYHEQLIQRFLLPHRVREQIESSSLATSERLLPVENLIAEMSENLHTSIEEIFEPFLESMLVGELNFFRSPTLVANFLFGLAAQYLRTDIVKKAREMSKTRDVESFERVSNVLVHIYAVNLAYNLYTDRERYEIALLTNHTEVPFITADQPVINIASSPKSTEPPVKFELYYPLSPTRAMLLVERSSKHLPRDPSLSPISVNVYNSLIAGNSFQQIYGNSQQVLEFIRTDLSAIRMLV